ncbi:MAG: cytochrome c biogenesis protein DipZ [Frankiaceae bacterium]|nr:cytochrome c biogenesis protein DipZ [Frankiaceae bacterium]MBV9869970.1 cytochrome c biogenesis protein DipZ [Frankiaceae bacterium]
MTSPLLLLVGFLAGLLTIISPCILPVLPAVIASGISTGGRRRALAIAIGLAIAFGFTTLFSLRVLSALHLPLTLRRDIGIGALIVLAVGFIVPQLGALIERPFAKLGLKRSPDATRSGFLLGATLGLLYVPCGGPILSALSAVGNTKSFGWDALWLTVAYSLGIALPMFGLVLLTERLSSTTTWLRNRGPEVRRVGGVLLLITAVAIAFGAGTSLQKSFPSVTDSLEKHVTRAGTSLGDDLAKIQNPNESDQAKHIQSGVGHQAPAHADPTADQVPTISATALTDYGKAPDFAGISQWFNTTSGAPLSLAELRGKVVLVDFWTYSCINCLRSLPHVEAWYERYRSAGLVVVGVHTPEFDFEHVPGNVRSAVSRLGIKYPVAMDNGYATWNAWGNNSWPAEYLIDPSGNVRYGSIGESDYGYTEAAIRALLPGRPADLPPTTAVPNRTPTEQTTPESYLGYERLDRYDGTRIVRDASATYSFASPLPSDHLTYSGQWTVEPQDIVAGKNAALRINVRAKNIFLVLSGQGDVTADLGGSQLATQHVTGVPKLYTIASGQQTRRGLLTLHVPPGVKAYAFTFG